MPPIDRLVSWFGARRIVAGNPGMGWMLVEIVPVMVWTRLTGAFNFEGGVYLVDYLRIVGASERHLAWLPLLFFGGTALSGLMVLRRRDRSGRQPEPRRICLIDTTVGRALWLAALAWPVAALALGCSLAWTLGPVLVGILLAQVWLLAGAGAWATWIRAIVPAPQRGPFLAWRNIASYLAVGGLLTLLTRSGWWPDEATATSDERFVFYAVLFAVVGAISLLAIWPLARAPRMPDEAAVRDQRTAAIGSSLRGRPGFARYAWWNAANTAAMACSLTWIQPLLEAVDLGARDWASWDGPVRIPMFLLGIVGAGALLHRLGGARLALAVNLLLVLGLLGFAGLLAFGPWLLPLAMALDGLGRGALSVSMIGRLHEVIPHGDARFPALWLAAGGLGGMAAAAAQLALVPWLGGLHAAGATAIPVAGWMLIAALGLRVISTPLLVTSRSRAGD